MLYAPYLQNNNYIENELAGKDLCRPGFLGKEKNIRTLAPWSCARETHVGHLWVFCSARNAEGKTCLDCCAIGAMVDGEEERATLVKKELVLQEMLQKCGFVAKRAHIFFGGPVTR